MRLWGRLDEQTQRALLGASAENALMIFGLSSKIFRELLPEFPGEGY